MLNVPPTKSVRQRAVKRSTKKEESTGDTHLDVERDVLHGDVRRLRRAAEGDALDLDERGLAACHQPSVVRNLIMRSTEFCYRTKCGSCRVMKSISNISSHLKHVRHYHDASPVENSSRSTDDSQR